jgi:hypothetical protein
MKVHELISLLAAYPPNAKVDINVPPEPHMGDWQDREIEAVGTAEQLVSIEPTPGWNLIISESTLDVATSEASGECKHGINRGDSCFECTMADIETTLDLDAMCRTAIEDHLDLRLVNVAAFCASELLKDWPDPEGIRGMAVDRFYAGFEDELMNSPADIPDEVREYDKAWGVFLDLAMKRAEESVRATRGYTEKV